jgi:glycosyltransferase involved in cell wall biosynthesis
MLADTYKPHVSGVTNHIALTKQVLERAGHEVYIFTFGDTDYVDDEKNVLRSRGLHLVDTGFFVNVSYSKQARQVLEGMDLLHAHHPFVSGTLGLRYGRAFGIPIVFTNHTRYDLYYQAYLPHLPERLGENFLSTFMPSFCARCDMVIAPSSGMRDVLGEYGVFGSIEIVPNGVDLEPIRLVSNPISRTQLGFSEDDILLLYVGRVGPEKNLPFLLKAFNGVSRTFEHARLVIVGDGPTRLDLVSQANELGISSKVHFTGLVPYAEIPRYLYMGDTFVTASVTEVHPLTVIEAMAAGLPVLGIKSTGVGDIVQDGVNGLLAINDMAAFTAKMARMVSAHEERERLGIGAHETSEIYDIDRTTNVLLEKYEQVIQKSKKQGRGVRTFVKRVLGLFGG